MTKQPTLFMLVGLPGSGKTTLAKKIENKHKALRFSQDDWVVALYGNNLSRPERDAAPKIVHHIQWQITKRVLSLGCNVVLDWGFWSQAERAKYRKEAKALNAKIKMIFLDAPIEVLWSRIKPRVESNKGSLQIKKFELRKWSKKFEPPTKKELSNN